MVGAPGFRDGNSGLNRRLETRVKNTPRYLE
jgi:hypothetical protein